MSIHVKAQQTNLLVIHNIIPYLTIQHILLGGILAVFNVLHTRLFTLVDNFPPYSTNSTNTTHTMNRPKTSKPKPKYQESIITISSSEEIDQNPNPQSILTFLIYRSGKCLYINNGGVPKTSSSSPLSYGKNDDVFCTFRCRKQVFRRWVLVVAMVVVLVLVVVVVVAVMVGLVWNVNDREDVDVDVDKEQEGEKDNDSGLQLQYTFGNKPSYCVTSAEAGIWDVPPSLQVGTNMTPMACVQEAQDQAEAVSQSSGDNSSVSSASSTYAWKFAYVHYWSANGDCWGLQECPFEYDCLNLAQGQEDCLDYDATIWTFTLVDTNSTSSTTSTTTGNITNTTTRAVGAGNATTANTTTITTTGNDATSNENQRNKW